MIIIYKPLGWTSLEVITQLKNEKPELKDKVISYAGRLDPMAEGLILLLVGEENKKRKQYESFDKTYEVTFFYGAATDSYDILGKVVDSALPSYNLIEQTRQILPSFVGTFTQPFPPYSSYKIKRKPLFYYAKKNLLETITIPTKERFIKEITYLGTQTVSKEKLLDTILERVTQVTGNFRQEEIKESWINYFEETKQKDYDLVTIQVICSSGTFMRSLVYEIGKKLNTPLVTYHIKRTRIGECTEKDAISFSSTKKA